VISNKKTKYRAFTLIELLVVVAIIGILAAVGVVAYNGYTKSAKRSAITANHKSVLTFMNAEIKKCLIQGGNLSLLTGPNNPDNYKNINCSKSVTNTFDLMKAVAEHLNNKGFVNPYDGGPAFYDAAPYFYLNRTNIGKGSNDTITIRTKYKDSNDSDVLMIDTLIDER
jgi:prepilin-type N-terminal cleavage/methylation domain-containing protein